MLDKRLAALAVSAGVKAQSIVENAHQHMALEAQSLTNDQWEFEIERLTQEFVRDLPSELWNDP